MTNSHKKRTCLKCNLLRLKHRLPGDGDWLFPTFGPPCSRCATAAPSRDLAAEFTNEDKTHAAFKRVPRGKFRTRLLIEHAREATKNVQDIAALQNDKAKALLGTSSFAVAAVLGLLAFVERTRDAVPTAVLLLEVALYLFAVSHVYRALRNAIQATTRNEVVGVPTQELLSTLSMKSRKEDAVNRRLAACYLATANDTHKRLLPRIRQILAGQISFKYAMLWGGVLLLFHIGSLFIFSATQANEINDSASSATVVGDIRTTKDADVVHSVDSADGPVSYKGSVEPTDARSEDTAVPSSVPGLDVVVPSRRDAVGGDLPGTAGE